MTKKEYNSIAEYVIDYLNTNEEIDIEQMKKEIEKFITEKINGYNFYDDSNEYKFRWYINELLAVIDFEKEIISNSIDNQKKYEVFKLIDDILREKLKKFNIWIL